MRNNAENMSCNLYEMWRRQSYNALRVILTTLIFGLITSSNLSQSTTVENDEADIRVVYACERTELSISCPNNGSMSSVIRIVNATFGRLTNGICATGGTPSVTCRAERSSEIVEEKCEYKPNCSIWANNSLFQDPCHGTAKYLSVTYKCSLTGCSSEEKRKIMWPKTDFGTQASVHCPNNAIGMAYRRCGQKHWEDDLDLSECVSKDLSQLSNQVKSNFSSALRKMETFSQKSDLYGGDLSFLADFLVNVTGLINSNPGILNSSTANKTTEKHEFALSAITNIGFAISIICLILAFLTFNLFRNLQCDRTTIHKNLIICLLISKMIFVFGIVQHDKPKLCAVIAGFLHYFFLASFAWMFAEGIHLYFMLTEVFDTKQSRVKRYYFGGYGVPAVIVLITFVTAAVKGIGYGTHDYCWLSVEQGFIWAFVGPVIAITLINSIILGVAIYVTTKHSATKASFKKEERTIIATIKSWIRCAAVLSALLGITWIFGVFYVSKGTVFLAYIFTILNSLQGFFIFLFHCLMNDKVMKEYRRVLQQASCLPECVQKTHDEQSGVAKTVT